MRITNIFLYKVHNIPYRFRGKYAKIRKPTFKNIMDFKNDLEREEENMLILRHPYLTIEQSQGHMKEARKQNYLTQLSKWRQEKNEKFNKKITISDRLNHLKVANAWD